ncbi:MBL fold metallo-hydrolase [Mucilaginibacter sp.]|jgi:phosphoribosyl 1,2-cyclic phosphodiesterase|uniref:MBL fold metallo-hydrolase n=1 Tax=Mucilaginibacter sp. TaxID=1882438 RepID=UPI002C6CAF57|nr:MBL fold metallo-hydrolase [Mucilaginibacter sp.]HTI60440.1 MBL fold metallo-hydrolase [Mucilaginibacter sp.]
MSLFIASLNSGSNGNCYYIGNDKEAILVDAGISCRETERRMNRLGLPMQKVKAIFVSHEHSDHINGIAVLSRKYKLPVYITPATLQSSGLSLDRDLVFSFKAYEPVVIGKISVSAFPKFHDAAHAHSFNITCNEVTVGVFTDIGMACKHLTEHFAKCHAAFLEANYDEEMLEKGRYPYHLKRRIRGGLGHLSNAQALEVFITHRPAFMSHLFLAHLSKDNNDPELVNELFLRHAGETEIVVASRFVETAVYHINGSYVPTQTPVNIVAERGQVQFSLF